MRYFGFMYRMDRREERQSEWHAWFAWHPVRMNYTKCPEDTGKTFWLETVERRRTGFCFIYREAGSMGVL